MQRLSARGALGKGSFVDVRGKGRGAGAFSLSGLGSFRSLLVISLLTISVGLLLGAAPSSAAPPTLWTKCPTGVGAGECLLPRGIAADPDNGHIFIADQNNARIDELNAFGQFIRAWGWGVDTGASKLETCTSSTTCQAGLTGTGKGQFAEVGVQGVAIDSSGYIYVFDWGLPSNRRVQKFSRTGEFILMFGGHVNKTKSEEPGSTEAQRNLCTAASGDECQAGTAGVGQGEFREMSFPGDWITIDDKGTESDADDRVYVGDRERIQIFNTSGVYQGDISLPGVVVQALASDAAGNLYAIYSTDGKVHKLSPSGEPLTPETFEIPKPSPFFAPLATAVTVSSAGHVFAFGPTNCCGSLVLNPITEFDESGKVIDQFGSGEFNGESTGLEANLCPGSEPPGNLYVSNPSSPKAFVRAYGTEPIGCFKARTGVATNLTETSARLNGMVIPSGLVVSECFFEYGTSEAYGQSAACVPGAGELGTGDDPVAVHADVGGLTKGTVHHFRLVAKVGAEVETGVDEEFKTLGPPTISSERTVSVAYTGATLKAVVNPEGFATTYAFQYTTEPTFEAKGFEDAESTPTIGIGSARGDRTVSVELKGLSPGTAYRWRIVAANSSGSAEGSDLRFITFKQPPTGPDLCANSAFRTGASAQLPDCRAYELVSPVDKNGGDIMHGLAGAGVDPGTYVQSAPDGELLAYGTLFSSFAGEPSSLRFNQYMAARSPVGWLNEGIHPPVPGHLCCEGLNFIGIYREFIAFSPDLCSAWILDTQAPPLNPDGQENLPNLYRRDNCGAGRGGLETLTSTPPALPVVGTRVTYVDYNSVQGSSDDARHAFFVAEAKFTPEAAETDNLQIYDRFEGTNRLVSVLPGGIADESGARVGGNSHLDNAVSKDGSHVYWTSGLGGKIHLRQHPEQGIVAGECTEPDKACTRQVSTGAATFWAAADDGSKAIYTDSTESTERRLREFDLELAEEGKPLSQNRRLIDNAVRGVTGASEDLSRIYFVSSNVIAGSGQNSEGDEAQAEKPNLYLVEGTTFKFIGTLVEDDVGRKETGSGVFAYDLTSTDSYERATRVTPDGSRIVFNSRAPLTGFDNTDPQSGKSAVEVFSYESTTGELVCISCNVSGARPSGVRELRLSYQFPFEIALRTNVMAAAWIPTWEHPLYASNVISEDGGRIFFNSNDALLPRDSNGAQDVYEWEAPGTGECDEGDAFFFAENGGCLYLVSSGESAKESEFWEASPDGDDVFFTTESSLLPQDPGSIDLYDARVGGGFPGPTPSAECEGEACQSPPPPPVAAARSSRSYQGSGNPPPPKKCPKGKRKVRKGGKVRCVRKGKAHKANARRRAAR